VAYLLNRLSDIKIYKWSHYDPSANSPRAGPSAVAGSGEQRNGSSSVPNLLSPVHVGCGLAALDDGSRRASRASKHDVLADADYLTWDALQQHSRQGRESIECLQ
jgi:hypothetical protein